MWRAYDQMGFLTYSFVEVVQAMHPYYIIRAVGGALFLIGALIMVWNIWKTIHAPDAQSEQAPSPALAAAE